MLSGGKRTGANQSGVSSTHKPLHQDAKLAEMDLLAAEKRRAEVQVRNMVPKKNARMTIQSISRGCDISPEGVQKDSSVRVAPSKVMDTAKKKSPVTEEHFNVMHALSNNGPCITWNQLLDMSPSVRTSVLNIAREKNELCSVSETALHAPRTMVDINGIKVETILDGGATVNIMSKKLMDKLGLKIERESLILLHLADGRTAKPMGEISNLVLKVENLFIPFDAIILPDCSYDLLLGRHWLASVQCVTNWSSGSFSITWKNREVELPKFEAEDADEEYELNASYPIEDILEPEISLVTETYLVSISSEESPKTITKITNPMVGALVKKFEGIFSTSPKDLGFTSRLAHTIDTGDSSPIACRPYRMGPHQKKIVRNLIDDMLSMGIITPSTSPWAFPITLVEKAVDVYRLCMDARRLNALTKKSPYLLPLVDELLEKLSGASIFSTLDMSSGYWQVALDNEAQEKATMATPFGLFSYRVMPFGLKNAPFTFQALMDKILKDCMAFTVVYLDDITVFSRSEAEHFEHLNAVFKIFKEENLKLNASKCHFFEKNINFLGFVISEMGIRMNSSKTSQIQNIPIPSTVKDVGVS